MGERPREVSGEKGTNRPFFAKAVRYACVALLVILAIPAVVIPLPKLYEVAIERPRLERLDAEYEKLPSLPNVAASNLTDCNVAWVGVPRNVAPAAIDIRKIETDHAGTKLAALFCLPDGQCGLAVLNVEDGRVTLFSPPLNLSYGHFALSDDGNRLAAVITCGRNCRPYFTPTFLSMIDVARHVISWAHRRDESISTPAFDGSGAKIVFVSGHIILNPGSRPLVASGPIWEIEPADGSVLRRLDPEVPNPTGRYKLPSFFNPSISGACRDGRLIVTASLRRTTDTGNSGGASIVGREPYEIREGVEQFRLGTRNEAMLSQGPSRVSRDCNRYVYVGRTPKATLQEPYYYDVFSVSGDGSAPVRVLEIDGSIADIALSGDGRVVFAVVPESRTAGTGQSWDRSTRPTVYRVEGRGPSGTVPLREAIAVAVRGG